MMAVIRLLGPSSAWFFENLTRYNAPPGTQQRMAVYCYASPQASEPTRDSVLAFTHGDTYKLVPGYKTM